MTKQTKKINFVTLGCSKNLVDSEKLMSKLHQKGYEIVHDSNETDAKIVVVNTCGFIADAKEESLNTILEFAYAKRDGLIEQLYVVGCLAERYKDELRAELPEVDDFFGVNNLSQLVELLAEDKSNCNLDITRILTTPNHYSYLKISEGCNWRCSYCAIPLIRGGHISQPIEDIVAEAKLLVNKGVKEIMLIAQDLTYYGLDIYSRRALADLLRELVKIDGLEWIRLHYAYPAYFPKDVIELMANEPKICKYLDIPFQHINTEILASMKRNITSDETLNLIKFFRATVPDMALRTTLIVGYPNETQEQFEELKEFVKNVRFERLGVFAYCSEENTPAGEMQDNVPQEVKERRVEEIMMLQNDIADEINKAKIGKAMRVVIDRYEGGQYIARSEFDSPEVDAEIIVSSEYDLQVGDFYDVTITDAEGYDIWAEL